MSPNNSITRVPWDSEVLGIDAYEIKGLTEDVLKEACMKRGHYSVKVDPLSDKKLLHRHGFYYCDTLIEPYCTPGRFLPHFDEAVSIMETVSLDDLVSLSRGAFRYGRFHRDFNIAAEKADSRYERFLREFHSEGNIISLAYGKKLAGYICYRGSKLILHALAEDMRGRGLAKYLWTPVCHKFFAEGHSELTSSVSAANLRVVNLYASLGFRFRHPLDVYHLVVG